MQGVFSKVQENMAYSVSLMLLHNPLKKISNTTQFAQ